MPPLFDMFPSTGQKKKGATTQAPAQSAPAASVPNKGAAAQQPAQAPAAPAAVSTATAAQTPGQAAGITKTPPMAKGVQDLATTAAPPGETGQFPNVADLVKSGAVQAQAGGTTERGPRLPTSPLQEIFPENRFTKDLPGFEKEPEQPPAETKPSSDDMFDDILNEMKQGWEGTQQQLAAQAASDQRRAAAINSAVGRSIGGGFAGLSAQAGMAASQNLAQARGAHNAQIRDAQLQWLDRVFQREESARARGHELDVAAAQGGTGEGGVPPGQIPTNEAGDQVPHYEGGLSEFRTVYGAEGDPVAAGLTAGDGYNDNWEWWQHAGEGGKRGGGINQFPDGVTQDQITGLRDSGGRGGNVQDKYRTFNGVRQYFGGKVPAIFAFNHGGTNDDTGKRGDIQNAAQSIADTLKEGYGIDAHNWYFDVDENGLWTVMDQFGDEIGKFDSNGKLVESNDNWDQNAYNERAAGRSGAGAQDAVARQEFEDSATGAAKNVFGIDLSRKK